MSLAIEYFCVCCKKYAEHLDGKWGHIEGKKPKSVRGTFCPECRAAPYHSPQKEDEPVSDQYPHYDSCL